jgi:hypothetical protein
VSFLEAWFTEASTRHPEIAGLVGPGSAAAADGERGLFAQRTSGDRIRVYLIRRMPLGRPVDEAELLDEYAHWTPRLRRLLTDHDGPLTERPIFALPVPHTWPTAPTVTLLGDAAHLMPPLGVGVDLAMLDACELATAIAEGPALEDAVRAYEKVMLPRPAEMQRADRGRRGVPAHRRPAGRGGALTPVARVHLVRWHTQIVDGSPDDGRPPGHRCWSFSQLALFILLGCTRGGSPGIFGWSGG